MNCWTFQISMLVMIYGSTLYWNCLNFIYKSFDFQIFDSNDKVSINYDIKTINESGISYLFQLLM